MTDFGKLFISIGAIFLLIGGLMFIFGRLTGLPKLPGDILIKNGNFTFYFPIVTSILLSIIFTIIINIFFRK